MFQVASHYQANAHFVYIYYCCAVRLFTIMQGVVGSLNETFARRSDDKGAVSQVSNHAIQSTFTLHLFAVLSTTAYKSQKLEAVRCGSLMSIVILCTIAMRSWYLCRLLLLRLLYKVVAISSTTYNTASSSRLHSM
jgi:ABC-type sulfate transport system permease subunit